MDGTSRSRSDLSSSGRRVAEDFLEHYGIKGMRWGVRRSRKELSKARSEGDVVVKAKGGKIKGASGGKAKKPSDDALDAAVTRQKLKKGSIDSLSNSELNGLVKRMELESKYANLTSKKKEKQKGYGKKFAESLIEKTISVETQRIAEGKETQTASRVRKALASKAGQKVVTSVKKAAKGT